MTSPPRSSLLNCRTIAGTGSPRADCGNPPDAEQQLDEPSPSSGEGNIELGRSKNQFKGGLQKLGARPVRVSFGAGMDQRRFKENSQLSSAMSRFGIGSIVSGRKWPRRSGVTGRYYPDKWHPDEVVITIRAEPHGLWRAVDSQGVVLEILMQKRLNARAAKRFRVTPSDFLPPTIRSPAFSAPNATASPLHPTATPEPTHSPYVTIMPPVSPLDRHAPSEIPHLNPPS